MKRVLAMLCAGGCAAVAYSQTQGEQPDTTKTQELQEVVVNGRTQRIVKFGVEYLPSKREKRAAIDATSLLRMMNVSQLNVSPEGSVSTITGEGVTMFIDYAPASAQGLKFNNWFDSNKTYYSFDSPHYSLHGWEESSNLSRNLTLTLVYTIPYGKKVEQGNELSGQGKSNSAILE